MASDKDDSSENLLVSMAEQSTNFGTSSMYVQKTHVVGAMKPVKTSTRRSSYDALKETHQHLLDDEAAESALTSFEDWMLKGNLLWYREEVVNAFRIIKEDIPKSVGGNGEVENLVVGPAVPMAFISNILTWGSFVAITVLGVFIVEVDNTGIAEVPSGKGLVVMGVFFLLFTLATLCFEYKALLYVLPSQSISAGRDAANMSIPFNKWLPGMLLVSFVLHTDIYTTGIFVARVVRSCQECSELNDHWRQLISNSAVLRHVPLASVVTFEELCYFCWFIMLAQMGYALAYSIPRSPNLHQVEIETTWPAYEMAEERHKVVEYHTLCKRNSGHGRALQALAESGRMSSLNWHNDIYLQQAEQDWPFYQVCAEMDRTNIRFFLFAMQSILIPHLQVTYMGVQKSHARLQNGEGSDWLTIGSICLTVVAGMRYVNYEVNSAFTHKKYVLDALKRYTEDAEERKDANDSRANGYHWEALMLGRQANFTLALNLFMCISFVVAFMGLLLKAFMVLAVCETGAWNLKFDDTYGCIPAEKITFSDCGR